MHIKLLIKTINEENFQKILDYYNNNKDVNEQPLERLERREGGFQIMIPEDQLDKINKIIDPNYKIQQLRLKGGYLNSDYIGFTDKQLLLLYDALVYVFPGKVILEDV
jgi:hypothetical protein